MILTGTPEGMEIVRVGWEICDELPIITEEKARELDRENKRKELGFMRISNQTYDVLKWIAQYLLPAAGTLYFALAGIWGLPYGEQVVGTITAVDTFLGVLLGLSSNAYNKELYHEGE